MPAHMRPNVTLRKPVKGTAAKARRARSSKVKRNEDTAKREAKERDGWHCTYPGCRVAGEGRVEAMHRVGAGMGRGRPCVDPDGYDTGCFEHHQGTRSVHSTHLKVTRDEDARGPLRLWWTRPTLDDDFVLLAISVIGEMEQCA